MSNISSDFSQLYNSNCPETSTCTDYELCLIAKEDAWHDHGSIKGLDPFDSASKHLIQKCNELPKTPAYKSATNPVKDEDRFMFERLLHLTQKPSGDYHSLYESYAKPVDPSLKPNIPGTNIPIFVDVCNTPNSRIGKINPEIAHIIYNNIHLVSPNPQESDKSRYDIFHISSKDTDEEIDPEEVDSLIKSSSENPSVSNTVIDKATTLVNSTNPEDTSESSLIQTLFQCLGITDDVYFIRDVGYGNFADDIYKWGKGSFSDSEQTATCLITSQGQYDPGPTVTCITDAGVRIGMGHYISNSSNRTIRETNPKIHFGMYDPDVASERITEYPIYPILPNIDGITTNRNAYLPQSMISTKFQSFMVSDIDYNDTIDGNPISMGNVNTILSSSNTTLYILDPTNEIGKNSFIGSLGLGSSNTKNIFTIDKNTSNKATTLDSVTKKISTNISGIGITSATNLPFDSTIYNVLYTSEEICKILSKKFGDHSQAIKTIDPTIRYIKFDCDTTNGSLTSPDFKLTKETSSGVHVFVTYDRVAATSAIEYGAPIVLFNNHDGFLIYVSKKIIEKYSSPERILETKLTEYKNIYNNINSKIQEFFAPFGEPSNSKMQNKLNDIQNKMNEIIGYLQIIITVLLEVSKRPLTDDQKYVDLLKTFYIFSPLMTIFYNFFTVCNNVLYNPTKDTLGSLSSPYTENSIMMYLSELNDESFNVDAGLDLNSYKSKNTLFLNYLQYLASFDKVTSSYDIAKNAYGSIIEKMQGCHSKKNKKNVTSFTTNIEKAFISHLIYINDLINKDTLLELTKISPRSTLSSDRVSRILSSCISNVGGTIPSLGIFIIKLIMTGLTDIQKLRTYINESRNPLSILLESDGNNAIDILNNTFTEKIHENIFSIKRFIHNKKQPVFNEMTVSFFAETGLPVPQDLNTVTGGKNTTRNNRNAIRKTYKNNVKMMKGGDPKLQITNRDKIVVAYLLSEYLQNYKNSIPELTALQTVVEIYKKDISLHFDNNVFLRSYCIEEFASVSSVDYLFEELSIEGQIYYRIVQLIIYILERYNEIQNRLVNVSESSSKINIESVFINNVEEELQNVIAELQHIVLEHPNDTIHTILSFLIICSNTDSRSAIKILTTIVLNYIQVNDDNTISNYISNTIQFGNEPVEKISLEYCPSIVIPKSQIISVNSSITRELDALNKRTLNISNNEYQFTMLSDNIFMSYGDFFQVLSFGASDEGRRTMFFANFIRSFTSSIDAIRFFADKPLNKLLIDADRQYIITHFGKYVYNMFFSHIDRFISQLQKQVVNTSINNLPQPINANENQNKIRLDKAINYIQSLNLNDKQSFISQLTVENIGKIVKSAREQSVREQLESEQIAREQSDRTKRKRRYSEDEILTNDDWRQSKISRPLTAGGKPIHQKSNKTIKQKKHFNKNNVYHPRKTLKNTKRTKYIKKNVTTRHR